MAFTCIMRTTITISAELLEEAQKLSGKSGYSEAIVTSLSDYVGLRKRLALLEQLLPTTSLQSSRVLTRGSLQETRSSPPTTTLRLYETLASSCSTDPLAIGTPRPAG